MRSEEQGVKEQRTKSKEQGAKNKEQGKMSLVTPSPFMILYLLLGVATLVGIGFLIGFYVGRSTKK